jgi:Nucleotide-diphospho-sugar transferase
VRKKRKNQTLNRGNAISMPPKQKNSTLTFRQSCLIKALLLLIIALLLFVYIPNLHRMSKLRRQQYRDLHSSSFKTTRKNDTSTSSSSSSSTPIHNNHSIDIDFSNNGETDPNIQFDEMAREAMQRSSLVYHQTYRGPLTKRNQRMHINRTKIVGFISFHYQKIAIRWYDRLETLGYNNHYIICTDLESYDFFQQLQTKKAYRVEASYLPPMKARYIKRKYYQKQKIRVKMLFAHRWVYVLEQLKLGNHILITDVDNIFSSYYDMNNLELSEFDVYHALETKHPEDVFRYQGFVFCGGMGWFRASPPTIQYVQEMVTQCGDVCDDQILLNRLVAYVFQVQWHRNSTSHQDVTVQTKDTNVTIDRLGNHFERLVGLVTKGFTGYSTSTGVQIHVWDRDFAYRGKADPSICPKLNWVSMPFVAVPVRSEVARAKWSTYDIWDTHCPNDYTAAIAAAVSVPHKRHS